MKKLKNILYKLFTSLEKQEEDKFVEAHKDEMSESDLRQFWRKYN